MSGGTAAGGRSLDRAAVAPWLRDHGVYVAFVLLLVFNLIFTENFASFGTFSNLLVQVSPVLLVSLGLALVIGTEGIDLSVGAIMALASAALPLYLGYGWPAAIGISTRRRWPRSPMTARAPAIDARSAASPLNEP